MRSMKRGGNINQLLCLAFVLTARPVSADPIIFQSALLGPTGQSSGATISPFQFLGARFSITEPAIITEIGGHMGVIDVNSAGSFFGAVIRLSGPKSLPTGSPFSLSDVVATTTFNLPFTTIDFLTPLSTTLTAGSYALVFGAGQFGSPVTAVGVMPNDNVDLPGASYFFWRGSTSTWSDDGISNVRFVVEGNFIPEPSALLLLGTLLAVLSIWQRASIRSAIASRG